MRRLLFLALLLALCPGGLSSREGSQNAARSPKGRLSAPTYYLAVSVDKCDSTGAATVSGASNLPPGAVINLEMVSFRGPIWDSYSDVVYATVGKEGFFSAKVLPKKGAVFPLNPTLWVNFFPSPMQPSSVLAIVGKHGENLGGFDNPQVELESGLLYLSMIARAYCR